MFSSLQGAIGRLHGLPFHFLYQAQPFRPFVLLQQPHFSTPNFPFFAHLSDLLFYCNNPLCYANSLFFLHTPRPPSTWYPYPGFSSAVWLHPSRNGLTYTSDRRSPTASLLTRVHNRTVPLHHIQTLFLFCASQSCSNPNVKDIHNSNLWNTQSLLVRQLFPR